MESMTRRCGQCNAPGPFYAYCATLCRACYRASRQPPPARDPIAHIASKVAISRCGRTRRGDKLVALEGPWTAQRITNFLRDYRGGLLESDLSGPCDAHSLTLSRFFKDEPMTEINCCVLTSREALSVANIHRKNFPTKLFELLSEIRARAGCVTKGVILAPIRARTSSNDSQAPQPASTAPPSNA